MNRRGFIALAGGGVASLPFIAQARPRAGKLYTIGLFHVGLDHVPPSLPGLLEGLKKLGYDLTTTVPSEESQIIQGRNIHLDWRNLPDEDAAHATAREFARAHVDLIVAIENQSVRAAKAATSEIPVVYLHVTDPVADGFV
jgi:putative ABC transport system substrate-binding protein